MFLCTFTYGIQIFMQHIIPLYITIRLYIIFIKYSTKYCDLEFNEYLSCCYYDIYLLKKPRLIPAVTS